MSMNSQDILDFLNKTHCVYQAAANTIAHLRQEGFCELEMGDRWRLAPGGKYFVSRNMSSVIAFKMGTLPVAEAGYRIAAVHLDSPALKLKLKGARDVFGCKQIPTEVYGGTINSTWLDRPLGIAGRIFVQENNSLVMKMLDIPCAAVIPNPAIHLARNINDGFSYNPQTHLTAILGQQTLKDFMAYAGNTSEIIDMDLFLYDSEDALLCGLDKSMVSASGLDNLASAIPALYALTGKEQSSSTQVVFFADNEEVGSTSPQGADSDYLKDTLERIILATGGCREDVFRSMAKSMLVSADAAHALHPNFPDKHDSNYAPLLNNGVVLKNNVSWRYCTTGASAAVFRCICEKNGVSLQDFSNRADMPCGSTVGPVLASKLGVPGVDIGIPLWAMHSIRETGGIIDMEDMFRIMSIFFYDDFKLNVEYVETANA